MIKPALIVVMIVCTGCAHTDEWTKRDTRMQIGVTVAMMADAYTTTKIQYSLRTESGWPTQEILGDNPSTSDTYLYFSTVALTNYLISRALPAKWRPYWQVYNISLNSYWAYYNCNEGLC